MLQNMLVRGPRAAVQQPTPRARAPAAVPAWLPAASHAQLPRLAAQVDPRHRLDATKDKGSAPCKTLLPDGRLQVVCEGTAAVLVLSALTHRPGHSQCIEVHDADGSSVRLTPRQFAARALPEDKKGRANRWPGLLRVCDDPANARPAGEWPAFGEWLKERQPQQPQQQSGGATTSAAEGGARQDTIHQSTASSAPAARGGAAPASAPSGGASPAAQAEPPPAASLPPGPAPFYCGPHQRATEAAAVASFSRLTQELPPGEICIVRAALPDSSRQHATPAGARAMHTAAPGAEHPPDDVPDPTPTVTPTPGAETPLASTPATASPPIDVLRPFSAAGVASTSPPPPSATAPAAAPSITTQHSPAPDTPMALAAEALAPPEAPATTVHPSSAPLERSPAPTGSALPAPPAAPGADPSPAVSSKAASPSRPTAGPTPPATTAAAGAPSTLYQEVAPPASKALRMPTPSPATTAPLPQPPSTPRGTPWRPAGPSPAQAAPAAAPGPSVPVQAAPARSAARAAAAAPTAATPGIPWRPFWEIFGMPPPHSEQQRSTAPTPPATHQGPAPPPRAPLPSTVTATGARPAPAAQQPPAPPPPATLPAISIATDARPLAILDLALFARGQEACVTYMNHLGARVMCTPHEFAGGPHWRHTIRALQSFSEGDRGRTLADAYPALFGPLAPPPAAPPRAAPLQRHSPGAPPGSSAPNFPSARPAQAPMPGRSYAPGPMHHAPQPPPATPHRPFGQPPPRVLHRRPPASQAPGPATAPTAAPQRGARVPPASSYQLNSPEALNALRSKPAPGRPHPHPHPHPRPPAGPPLPPYTPPQTPRQRAALPRPYPPLQSRAPLPSVSSRQLHGQGAAASLLAPLTRWPPLQLQQQQQPESSTGALPSAGGAGRQLSPGPEPKVIHLALQYTPHSAGRLLNWSTRFYLQHAGMPDFDTNTIPTLPDDTPGATAIKSHGNALLPTDDSGHTDWRVALYCNVAPRIEGMRVLESNLDNVAPHLPVAVGRLQDAFEAGDAVAAVAAVKEVWDLQPWDAVWEVMKRCVTAPSGLHPSLAVLTCLRLLMADGYFPVDGLKREVFSVTYQLAAAASSANARHISSELDALVQSLSPPPPAPEALREVSMLEGALYGCLQVAQLLGQRDGLEGWEVFGQATRVKWAIVFLLGPAEHTHWTGAEKSDMNSLLIKILDTYTSFVPDWDLLDKSAAAE